MILFWKVVIIGDANGAILAYDALCSNNNLDDTNSLYGEGNLSYFVFLGCHTTVGEWLRDYIKISYLIRKDIRRSLLEFIKKVSDDRIVPAFKFIL